MARVVCDDNGDYGILASDADTQVIAGRVMLWCAECGVWCVVRGVRCVVQVEWFVVSAVGPTPHFCLDNSLCLQVFV
jgi:hypothetical protein